jgi:TetR/AcrR family transcriptional repressor of nem operon
MGRTSDADQRLMAAALDLIWEESYGSVTIDDICKRAEVKKGSFYYFYDSKAQLAVAALDRLWTEDWKPRMDGIFSASVDPLGRLRNYLTAIYDRQRELKKKNGRVLGCPVASVGSEISTLESDICSKTREMVLRKRRYLESAIREAMADGSIEAGDAAKRTVVLASFIEGMMMQARMMNDPEILKDLPEMGLEILRVRSTEPAPVAAATAS